jgi:hypothetical protein
VLCLLKTLTFLQVEVLINSFKPKPPHPLMKQSHQVQMEPTSNNVKVLVRVRPATKDQSLCISTTVNTTTITDIDSQTDRCYSFDHCFPQTSTTATVYNELGDLVRNALSGENCCIFAYGETGSGKTHTMMGSGGDPGVIPLFIRDLFDNGTFGLSASCLEIYNEKVYDLLSPASSPKLRVRYVKFNHRSHFYSFPYNISPSSS